MKLLHLEVTACALLLAACAAGTVTPEPPAKVAQAPTPAPLPEPPPPKVQPSPASPAPTPAPGNTAPAKPAPAKPAPAKTAPAPTAAPAKSPPPASAPPASAPLDLTSLEQRLKDTSAIGVLTKLSLKNQVDDLIGKFRAYHQGARPPTLTDLRPAFELLLMKVLSLLQDHDPALARDINASRDAIWGVLTDPHKLAQLA
jgi:hypothetical protein